ncbi:MAG: hypothetical protein ACLFPL_00860 [Candidatus Nanoarchaeia archaeon]
MNYRYQSVFFILILELLLLSVSYSADFPDGQTICCYNLDSNGVDTDLAGSCKSNSNNFILGVPNLDESLDSINKVDEQCTQLVLDQGVNCQLNTGEYDTSRFYLQIDGTNYPQRSVCEYSSNDPLAWYTGSVEIGGGENQKEDDTGVIIIDPNYNSSEEFTIADEDLGQAPFSETSQSSCSSTTPFGELFLSKSTCEARGDDCVYDPYRIGALVQNEGDSNDEGIFSSLRPDSMCVSKSNEIRVCEDIRSKKLCQDYESELNPNDESLMGIYGCEWRSVNSQAGKCVTKDLYFENQEAKDSSEFKSIRIENSIQRKNFITNPLFEVTQDSNTLDYWEGQDYSIESSAQYDNLHGSNVVRFSSSNSQISQFVSGVPGNVELELKIIATEDARLQANINGEELTISQSNPLFSYDEFESNLHAYTFVYQNTIENADLDVEISATTNNVDILAVSLSLPRADVSATQQNAISNVYAENMFPQDSFMCSMCEAGFSSDFCQEELINKFGNCELVADDTQSRYQSSVDGMVNPYIENPKEEKNTFIEEDMVFCGVYSNQRQCEGDNKLNSIISNYHSTDQLCRWDGARNNCYKDSDGNNEPDILNNGQLSEFSSLNAFDEFTIDPNTDDTLNDFQLSCDVLPPRLSIMTYKKILNNGEVEVVPASGDYSTTPGVLDFVVVNLEEPVSPQCRVYENYESSVTLNFETSTNNVQVPFEDIFDEYERGSEFFQKIYSYDEFKNLISGVVSDVDDVMQNGKLTAYDRAGNKDKLSHEFSSTNTYPNLDFEFELTPQSENEVYPITELSVNSLEPDLEIVSCDIFVADVDDGFSTIINEQEVSSQDLNERYNIGERIAQNEGSIDEGGRETFPVELFIECRDVFGQSKTDSGSYIFSNQDEIIVHQFGDLNLLNLNNTRYMNPQTKEMFLNISAKEGVSCENSYVQDSGEDEIDNFGEIPFSTGSSVDVYNQSYSTTLDFSSIDENGMYTYVQECSFQGGYFEKQLDFEYDDSSINIDSLQLQEQDESKWKMYKGNLYINAVDRSLVSSTGTVDTNGFNNYLNTNVELFIDTSEEEINKINIVSICSSNAMDVDSNITPISQNILGNLDDERCEVDSDFSQTTVKFISDIELESITGFLTYETIDTFFEVSAPKISIGVAGGGEAVSDVIYYNSNNPELIVDMGLRNDRDFTCDMNLEVGGNSFSVSRNSLQGEVRVTASQITDDTDVIGFNPNAEKTLTVNCEEDLFNQTSSKTFKLEEDSTPPQIEDIEFSGLGKNWGLPLVGNSELTSDVQIILNNSEEYISCTYQVNELSSNSFIDATNSKTVDAIGTSIVEDSEALIVTRDGNRADENPYFLITSGAITNPSEVQHTVRVECIDGAGNSDQRVFEDYTLNLFNYGQIDVQGSMNSQGNLDITVESLTNLQGSSVKLIDKQTGEVLIDDNVDSMQSSVEQSGSIYRLHLNNALDLSNYESTPDQEFEIDLFLSQLSPLTDEFSVAIDSQAPTIDISLNTNGEDIIYSDSVSGQISVREELSYSSGLEEVIVTLNSPNGVNESIFDSNLGNELVNNIDYSNLPPSSYTIDVQARDKNGNENSSSVSFELSNDFSINVLDSQNTFTSSEFSKTWYTQSENPTLRFETTTQVGSCRLTPGDNSGYYGVQYEFDTVDANIYELDLSNENSFEIRDGRRKVIISCESNNESEPNYDVAAYLYNVKSVPDYTVEFEWGQTQYILPSENAREINFEIIQKSSFKDVVCEANLESQNNNRESVKLLTDDSNLKGSYSGIIEQGVGEYTLEVVCENPLGTQGPTKRYDVSVLEEQFDVNIVSLTNTQNSDININVDNSPIRIPQGTSQYNLQFSTNYQSENLECTVDVSNSGVLNFLESLFFNTKIDATQGVTQFGVYETPIEITSETDEILITCNDGSIFSSPPISFPVEIVNTNNIEVDVESIQGER